MIQKTYRSEKRLFRGLAAWIGAGLPVLAAVGLLTGLAGAGIGSYLTFSQGLPTIPDLRSYRPKTVSTFYAEDDSVIGVFFNEKRFPVPVDSMPPHVVQAFLAAEDARFFSHPGVDWIGVLRALVTNFKTGNFSQGASTITQQVTRNFLLSREKKISRKIREAILAHRLEKTLTKNEILNLYLNDIYFGKGAYGVEAAARTYFGKRTDDLTIAEAALLAGLVSSPARYSPQRNVQASLERRAFVLGSMLRNGFITQDQHQVACGEVPRLIENSQDTYPTAPYFTEAVRQYILSRYGEDRLYNEGLRVWTTCDPQFQQRAVEAVQHGAKAWEKRERRPSGLVRRASSEEARAFLSTAPGPRPKPGDLVDAVVVKNHTAGNRKGKKDQSDTQDCILALQGNTEFRISLQSAVAYRTNDVLQFRVIRTEEDGLELEQDVLPPVQGALVCIENSTGYVRGLVGGLDFERSVFNRATQAVRQPGSAFKPFVYAAALESGGYSTNTTIVDEPIAVHIHTGEPEWIPMNSDGTYMGPIDLRRALAQSRNTVAVKLLMDVGIDSVISTARAMGIGSRLSRHMSLCLGASEVTLLDLTAAYTVFPNMGIRLTPVLVKKVVDRFGNVLEDNSAERLDIYDPMFQASWWNYLGSPGTIGNQLEIMPNEPLDETVVRDDDKVALREPAGTESPFIMEDRLQSSFPGCTASRRPELQRVISPQTAYLMVSMLREACRSGTAAAANRLKRNDIAGKTGTTDDCTDAWFIGFDPNYTTGVWMGHDAKVSLGHREYGGAAALPVWMEFMSEALHNRPVKGYPTPPGIVFADPAGAPPSSRIRNLLEAGPDFPLTPEIKKVSPVDAPILAVPYYQTSFDGSPVPASVALAPLTGLPFYGGFGPTVYPGSMRVLSATGETLGYATYMVDRRGRITLFHDYGGGQNAFHSAPLQPGISDNPARHSGGADLGGERQQLPLTIPYGARQ